MVHDFKEQLAYSHAASDNPIWEQVYQKAFPGFTAMVDHREHGEHQFAGIDRSIIMPNSKVILIDEKVRETDYGDIALEYLSSTRSGAPGWVCKPLRCDYIVYAILPAGKAYVLPVVQLQEAWRRRGDEWIAKHKRVCAVNRGYNTISVAVPVSDLFMEIGRALRISFTPVTARPRRIQ